MNNVTVNENDVLVSVVSDEITVTITDSVGIPAGGTANQVLKKNSATDYDVSWASDVAGVPYTGATQDVDLGEFGLLTGNLEFDTSPTNAPTGAGSVVWNDTEGTLDLMLKGGSVNIPIGQKQVIRAVNGTGGNLTRAQYRAVKITGAQGQRLQVSLARADDDLNSKDTIGIVGEDISNNQTGFIVSSGTIDGLNTTGNLQGETWTDGDTLYLSGTTFGVITNVKPAAPVHTVILGFVVYAHANNGKIYVKVDNGYELDELHNVNVSTAASGDYLRYNGTTWVDATISAADLPSAIDASKIGSGLVSNTEFGYLDGVTSAIQTQLNAKQATLTNPVTGTGTSGQVLFFNGTSTVTGDNGLFWDNTNKRLGVGTTSPAFTADVSGTLRTTSYITIGNADPGLAIVFPSGRAMRSSGSIYIDAGTTSGDLIFRTSSSVLNRLIIFNSGNLTVGGSVDGGYLMDIQGTLRNTTSAYFATSSGGVGVGTTSPISITDYGGLSISGTNGSFLSLLHAGTQRLRIEFNGNNDAFIGTIGSHPLGFRTNSVERMRLTAAGRLLIGTTTESTYLLDVAGTARVTGDFTLGANTIIANQNTYLTTSVVNGYTALSLRPNGTGSLSSFILYLANDVNNSGYLQFASNGNIQASKIGTGVTPDIKFYVGANIGLRINANAADGAIIVSGSNIGFFASAWGTSATNTIALGSGVAPTTSPADAFQLYSADITAGNAAPHFRTEGGAVVKIYQQTTGVGAATRVGGGGTTVTDTDTFDGYTINQIVKALRNAGFLA